MKGNIIAFLLLGFLLGWSINAGWLRVIEQNSFEIIVDGKKRDIRSAPHWDLIRIAWKNNGNRLMLKLAGDQEQHYNWFADRETPDEE